MGELSGGAGEFEFCIEDGCHEFMMTDSWGDGWNGGAAVLRSQQDCLCTCH